MKKQTKSLLAMMAVLPASGAFACASCGCTLNSDWGAKGVSNNPGWSLDVHYDTLNQNQLRAGTATISAFDAANACT